MAIREVPDTLSPRESVYLARAMAAHSNRAAQVIAAVETPTIADDLEGRTGAGQPLAPPLKHDLERDFDHDLSHVRVHHDAASDRATRGVFAHAVTVGGNVFLRSDHHPASASTRGLLRHEVAHVVQQTRPGRPGATSSGGRAVAMQRAPDPLQTGLAAKDVTLWTPADLQSAETRLSDEARKDPKLRDAFEANLAVVQAELSRRGLAVKPYWGMRKAATADDKASPEQIISLQSRIDVLLTLLEVNFANNASTLVTRLQDERKEIDSLHKDDVLREGDRLEAMQTTLDAITMVKLRLPPAAPVGLETQFDAVWKAIRTALSDLGTPLQSPRLVELQTAANTYIDAYSKQIIDKTSSLLDTLKGAPKSFDEANGFINGWAPPGGSVIQSGVGSTADELWKYSDRLGRTIKELEGLGDLKKLAGASAADRMKFLEDHAAQLTELLKRGQALSMMSVGFDAGTLLMKAVTHDTYQVVWTDIAMAREIRDSIVVPLAKELDNPSDATLSSAGSRLNSLAWRVNDRLKDVQKFQERMQTALQVIAIAASLFGGMAAMEAAGGSGVAASGAVNIGQFVRGSLAFSFASQMITSVVTGQPITWSGALYQTGMDLATMGLLHNVSAGLGAKFGGIQNIPVGLHVTVQFSTLWAWSAGMSLLQQVSSGQKVTGAGAVKAIGEAGKNTALGFAMLGMGSRIGRLPTVEAPTGVPADVAVRQRSALAMLEDVRARGTELEAEIKAWGEKGENPVELERLMRESEHWYGSFRKAVDGLAETEVLTKAQAEAVKSQTVNHVAELRNLRDMSTLWIRETGEQTVAYSGEVHNLDAFLGRLKRQENIKSYEPVAGRAGIYRVTGADGRVTIYYPEGPASATGKSMNLAAEALAESFPSLDADVRANAATALNKLSPLDATRLGFELTGPNGEAVVKWLAKLNASGVPRFLSADLLIACMKDPALRARFEAADLKNVDVWWDTPFEKAMGDRAGNSFLGFLEEIRSRRGNVDVKTPGEALAITEDLAKAQRTMVPVAQQMALPTGAPTPVQVADTVQQLRQQGFTGEIKEVVIDGQTRLLQIVNGQIVRSWIWKHGVLLDSQNVAEKSAALRKGIAAADKLSDPKQRAAALEALRPLADELAYIRRIRGESISDILQALDRIRPLEVKEPEATSTTTPATEAAHVPVTTKDVIVTRHRALMERATNMGLLEDPLVGTLTRWNPAAKQPINVPADPIATLDAIETHMNALRDSTLKRFNERIGYGNIRRLQAEAFGGRADFADFLVQLRGKHGVSLEALKGLGYMTKAPPPGEPAINVEKVFELARTAEERNMVLEQFGRLVGRPAAQGGSVPGAYRMLADMTASAKSWRGGAWTLRALETAARRGHFKLEDIRGLEETETLKIELNGSEADVVRRYDVTLTSGEKLEMKSWTRWFPETIESQFRRDVLLQTRGFENLAGLDKLRWVFEGAPGITELTPSGPRFRRMPEGEAKAAIQKAMEAGLEKAMDDRSVDPDQRVRILQRFRAVASRIIIIDSLETSKP